MDDDDDGSYKRIMLRWDAKYQNKKKTISIKNIYKHSNTFLMLK